MQRQDCSRHSALEYNLAQHLLAIAVDNVNSNTKAIALVTRWLEAKRGVTFIIGLHVRCEAHVGQIFARAVLRAVAFVCEKAHISHISSSIATGRVETYQACGDGPVTVPSEANKTRWSGEYKELLHIDGHQHGVDKYIETVNSSLGANLQLFTNEDRGIMQLAIKVLQPLEVFTTKLEGQIAGVMAAEWFIDLWIQLQSFVHIAVSQKLLIMLQM